MNNINDRSIDNKGTTVGNSYAAVTGISVAALENAVAALKIALEKDPENIMLKTTLKHSEASLKGCQSILSKRDEIVYGGVYSWTFSQN